MSNGKPQDRQILLDYLDNAPAEIADWAAARKAELDETPDSSEAAPGRVSPVEAEEDTEDAEESEDFYNDMEGEDDLIHDRLHRKAKAGRAAKSGKNAGDDGSGTTPSRERARGFGRTSKLLLAAVLVIGITGGVYVAGQNNESEPQADTPTMNAQTQDDSKRLAELEGIVQGDPSDVDARLELGVLYFNNRDVEKAQDQWLKVVDLDPEAVAAWYNLGFAYLSMEPSDTDKAYEAWEKVVELDPDSEEAQTVSMHMDGIEEMSGDPTGDPSGDPTDGPAKEPSE